MYIRKKIVCTIKRNNTLTGKNLNMWWLNMYRIKKKVYIKKIDELMIYKVVALDP